MIAQQILDFRTPGCGASQGLYLWEHRHAQHARRVILTVMGES